MRVFLIIIVLVIAAIAVGGYVLVGNVSAAANSGAGDAGGQARSWFSAAPDATEVKTEAVVRKTLAQSVSAPGELEPLTKVEISAEVSSRIVELPFRENDEVKKGDVLVRLDDKDLQAARDAAVARRDGEKFRLESENARLEGLISSLHYAKRNLERQNELLTGGDIPRKAIDDAQERVDDLQASLEAARHSISVLQSSLAGAEADILRAEDGLAKTIMRSPMDGIVTVLNAEIGELVVVGTMNSPGTVILMVADLSKMILNAKLAEIDVTKVERGQRAKIHINAFPDEVFEGDVLRVALQRTAGMGQESGYFKAEVNVHLNGRRLLSGLAANVDIEIATHEGLVVPSQAIVDRELDKLPESARSSPLVDAKKTTASVTYRVVDGKTVCVPVKAGASDLTHTIVSEGLSEGDRVVSGPYKVLKSIDHDTAVKEMEDRKPEPAPEKETQSSGVAVRVGS